MDSLQTIDAYLQLTDWHFEFSAGEGKYGEYYWLSSFPLGELSLLDVLPLPQHPFQVLITFWDWPGGASEMYGRLPDWRAIGPFALSNLSTTFPASSPELESEGYTAFMILDEPFSDEAILKVMKDFSDPEPGGDPDSPEHKALWKILSDFNAYCYSCDYTEFLALRGAEQFEQLRRNIPVERVEGWHRDREAQHRAYVWKNLGPECGPEKCIEQGCDRLRIQLAIRCFIHQLLKHHGIHHR